MKQGVPSEINSEFLLGNMVFLLKETFSSTRKQVVPSESNS